MAKQSLLGILIVLIGLGMGGFDLEAGSYPGQRDIVFARDIDVAETLQSAFSGDGVFDYLALRSRYSTVSVHLSGATVANSFRIDSATTRIATIDVDRDGDVDVLGISASGIKVWINNSEGLFRETSSPDLMVRGAWLVSSLTESECDSLFLHESNQFFHLADLSLVVFESGLRTFVPALIGATSGRSPPSILTYFG